VLNVDYEAIRTSLQQFIEIGHLGLGVLFENLESVGLNFIGSDLTFQVLVAAFLEGLNETSVHLEKCFGIKLVNFSRWVGDSKLLFLREPHVSHVVLG
jgi:hypothetical protein